MDDSIDERYRKFLQTILIRFLKQPNKIINLNVKFIKEIMNISKEEAELYYNIFNYTSKFLDVLNNQHQKDYSKIKTETSVKLSMTELFSFSDFSILSSKVPLGEKDFVKCENLVRIKQKYPFLFRFVNGKWKSSAIGENIGKEFKSFSKMNMIPPKLVLENIIINIEDEK